MGTLAKGQQAYMCLTCKAGLPIACHWISRSRSAMGGPLGQQFTKKKLVRRKKVRKYVMSKYLRMLAEYGQLYSWTQWIQYKKEERFWTKERRVYYQQETQDLCREDWESIPGFPGWPKSAIAGSDYFED